eukprot:826251-Amphidinium_carterae.1
MVGGKGFGTRDSQGWLDPTGEQAKEDPVGAYRKQQEQRKKMRLVSKGKDLIRRVIRSERPISENGLQARFKP